MHDSSIIIIQGRERAVSEQYSHSLQPYSVYVASNGNKAQIHFALNNTPYWNYIEHIKNGKGLCTKKIVSSDLEKQTAYPQSPNLCEPATESAAKVVGGGGTDVTCCQVGTKICCARLDQDC